MAAAPKSCAGVAAKLPLNDPTAVRAAPTITMSVVDIHASLTLPGLRAFREQWHIQQGCAKVKMTKVEHASKFAAERPFFRFLVPAGALRLRSKPRKKTVFGPAQRAYRFTKASIVREIRRSLRISDVDHGQ
jgi:hypothetical protein